MVGKIQNRELFLTKIAERLGRGQRATTIESPVWNFQPQDDVLKGASSDDLLHVLREQCKNIHTDFFTTNISGLPETIKSIIFEYGGGPIITWSDPRFEAFGLSPLFNEILPSKNIKVDVWDSSVGQENIKLAEKANIGITISEITLAESGTAVIFSSKDRGRSISFLPATSVIIIPKSSIVPRMTQAARLIRKKVKNGEEIASCVNFITGPSNSADIELNLVVGVHGPTKAAYIVVEDI
ncbi:lactate utilization protein C [Bacillus sp. DTU_2020_1000418_1_SI_GHA_SEK_038]|uniref:LutC/YkgG family protein n=1 Tax=Bacillus sp. DTU_2020_1000418_1_SI_GHA_SEK_038 TaxID=3077585 RepID=UPI0028E626C6|nr:lactate utilization protein C [Bacillus sp. DTU_2020_1000418_1_SI_GHA_SEK_038]WNS76952.1 lactate utilization protein C [Bacillus sp. DTU_2020_1000418_1_SI_GHA_SEK_038]